MPTATAPLEPPPREPLRRGGPARFGTWRTWKRILRVAAPQAPLLIVFLLIVTLDAVVGIVNPLIYRKIVNDAIPSGDIAMIVRLSSTVAFVGLCDALIGLLKAYTAAAIGGRITLDLRSRLFAHIGRMSIAFFTRARTGALVSRINNDVAGAQSAFTDILSTAVGNSITLILVLIAMFALSWRITVAVLVVLPVLLLPARAWGKKLQSITRQGLDLTASMNSMLVEHLSVGGAQIVQLYGRQADQIAEFKKKAKQVSDLSVARTVYGRLFVTALTVAAVAASALTYGWGGVLVVRHVLDLGTVIALVSFLTRLYSPLMSLSNTQGTVMSALVSFQRVFEVLDIEPLVRERADPETIPPGPATVTFEHVCFRYPSSEEAVVPSLGTGGGPVADRPAMVLDDVSFTALPGQIVALIGPSGSGKTTAASLVSRQYDPLFGKVSINGVDIRNASLTELRRRVGVVSQEPHFFCATIRANMLFAKPTATETEIRTALRSAQILPMVETLPQGLETVIGERGYRLSGGERQRLAIARMLLTSPDVVILDEATAHLDMESEAAVHRAIEEALRGRTCLVISHHLSTIQAADQTLVMKEGRLCPSSSRISTSVMAAGKYSMA